MAIVSDSPAKIGFCNAFPAGYDTDGENTISGSYRAFETTSPGNGRDPHNRNQQGQIN